MLAIHCPDQFTPFAFGFIRVLQAFATTALIGPWVEDRLDGPVDKADFVMFYDDACMSSLESLVTLVGAGGTARGSSGAGQLRRALGI